MKRFKTLREDKEDLQVLSKRLLAALVMIISGDSRNVSFESTYNCTFKMLCCGNGSVSFRSSIEMIEYILQLSANIVVRTHPYTDPNSERSKMDIVQMIKDCTAQYHRISDREGAAGMDSLVMKAEEEFFNSKQQVVLRHCHFKFKEMAERARFAVLAKPGGADFLAVQQQHVEAGSMGA